MAEPTLILHAGPHKTGSSALQIRLLAAREHLQRHGYDYPSLGLWQYGHHHINSFLRGDHADAADVTEAALRGLASLDRNLILSSEDFINQTPERLEHLAALLDGFKVQVVLFVRSPVTLWPSHWQELIKHGHQETLLEYLGSCFGLNSMINARFLHPVSQAQRFAQAFGRRNIRLFCYDNILAEGIDLFEFFIANILHLPPLLPRQPTPVINPSMPTETTEMLRCLNERWRCRSAQSPRSAIAAAYLPRHPEFAADPRYPAFQAGLAAHALTVQLESENDLLRARERRLLRLFGDRIENLASADRIFRQDDQRVLPFAPRYWIDRCGIADFIDDVLARLDLADA